MMLQLGHAGRAVAEFRLCGKSATGGSARHRGWDHHRGVHRKVIIDR
jgi:hypothetical protein